ncbi:MAG: hypothetical protein ACRD5M_12025 [Candidatus Acidiferrales bacterium]
MWVPPYFGSYEQLVRELLHNPFLGSPQPPPHNLMLQPRSADPQPSPWRTDAGNVAEHAVLLLISAATAKETASAVANKETANQINASAENAINEVLDDFCGTPPRNVPWPFPGPPPWVWEIASQLSAAANTLQEGSLRTSLLQISGRVIEKGLGQTRSAAAGARG